MLWSGGFKLRLMAALVRWVSFPKKRLPGGTGLLEPQEDHQHQCGKAGYEGQRSFIIILF